MMKCPKCGKTLDVGPYYPSKKGIRRELTCQDCWFADYQYLKKNPLEAKEVSKVPKPAGRFSVWILGCVPLAGLLFYLFGKLHWVAGATAFCLPFLYWILETPSEAKSE